MSLMDEQYQNNYLWVQSVWIYVLILTRTLALIKYEMTVWIKSYYDDNRPLSDTMQM